MVAGDGEDNVFYEGARALVQRAEGVGAADEGEVEGVCAVEDGACFFVNLLVKAKDGGDDGVEGRRDVRGWAGVAAPPRG